MGIWYSAPSKVVFPDTATPVRIPADRTILIRHRPTCGEADIENTGADKQENTRNDDTKRE